MNNALLVALLSGGSLLGILSLIYTIYKDLRDRKVQQAAGESGVQLTKTQEREVAAQAASINTADIIKIGELWQKQFNDVRKELEIEQRWRKRVTKYIRRHQPWDIEMEKIAKENNWPISPAPRIDLTGEDDDDDDELDQNPWHQ